MYVFFLLNQETYPATFELKLLFGKQIMEYLRWTLALIMQNIELKKIRANIVIGAEWLE